MENPIKMDDLGVPLFLETPIYEHQKNSVHETCHETSLPHHGSRHLPRLLQRPANLDDIQKKRQKRWQWRKV